MPSRGEYWAASNAVALSTTVQAGALRDKAGHQQQSWCGWGTSRTLFSVPGGARKELDAGKASSAPYLLFWILSLGLNGTKKGSLSPAVAEKKMEMFRICPVAWIGYFGKHFLHQDFLYFTTHATVSIGQLTTTKECNENSTLTMVKYKAECFEIPCKPLCCWMLFVIWKKRDEGRKEFEDKATYVG